MVTVRTPLVPSLESGFPGILEEVLLDIEVVPPGALEPGSSMVTAVNMDTGAEPKSGVKSVAVSDGAVAPVGRDVVS